MKYSPEEELKFKKVLLAFSSYIEESNQLEIIRTPKAGYVYLTLEGEPPMAEDGFTVETAADMCDLLMREIGYFPEEIATAARNYDPARITRYVTNVATLFHKFYTTCRCKGVECGLQQARLALCLASKTVLENVLSILKIDAPETM